MTPPNMTPAQRAARERAVAHLRSIQQRVADAPYSVTDSCGVTRGFQTQAEAEAWRAQLAR